MTLANIVKAAHETAVKKGWWDKERPFLEQVCLMHSELSEATEAYRNAEGGERIVEELADTIIRIFDTCGRYNWNLERALYAKMKFNKKRPYRHGGKVA